MQQTHKTVFAKKIFARVEITLAHNRRRAIKKHRRLPNGRQQQQKSDCNYCATVTFQLVFSTLFFFDNRVHRRVRSLSSAETKPQLCAISLTSRLEDRQGPIR
jgi:hypothetical protein